MPPNPKYHKQQNRNPSFGQDVECDGDDLHEDGDDDHRVKAKEEFDELLVSDSY